MAEQEPDTAGPAGIQPERVEAWFAGHVPGAQPPLSYDLVAGGRSNLTYVVSDAAGRRWVLRRPPLGTLLESAHDMGREHRIISALGPTDVPVPTTIGFCDDEEVTGAPFYVMEYVAGRVVRTRDDAGTMLGEAERARAAESLVDTLVRLHAVDPDAVGLGQLGRKEGYIARQLRRWHGQWEQSKTRELPAMEAAHRALTERTPAQGPATIVHGDYRLDNVILGGDAQVSAVLDWEICTLGDPLADVGQLFVYWGDPEDEITALPDVPTTAPGFPRPQEVAARYGEVSGRDLSDLDFYVAFGYWKIAAILEGVYARHLAGAYGRVDERVQGYGERVGDLAQAAADRLGLDGF